MSYRTGARYVLSAVSVLVVAQPSSEVPEGLMNYPVFNIYCISTIKWLHERSTILRYIHCLSFSLLILFCMPCGIFIFDLDLSVSFKHFYEYVKLQVKVKVTLEQKTKAQNGNRLFL
jgi:hypothetical protein